MTTPLGRSALFADQSLVGTVFCRAYARRVDEWLAGIFDERVGHRSDVSLVATGGFGRGTLCPQSDLDVMLLHRDLGEAELSAIATELWNPIWDEGIKLGHSVRTHKSALKLAQSDLDTATSLVSLRHLAGDSERSAKLVAAAQTQWRKQAAKWLPELADAADRRRVDNGEVAFLLEPDLKNSGGGLRDVDALNWAAESGVEVLRRETKALREAKEVLLACRVELHRSTNRFGDVLLLDEQDPVASALGYADADRLMAEISAAGRTISWLGDDIWARARSRSRRRFLGRSARPQRVGPGLVLDQGTLKLTDRSMAQTDPTMILRAAVAAASHGARIDRESLDTMAADAQSIPTPWSSEVRSLFVDLLSTGHRAIPVIEALDQVDMVVHLLPEWEPTRSKPQRNIYHTFTVDRHLLEAAANAAELTERVDRPDLLVVGALLHDIGKGYPGDHTVVGMELVDTIAPRMGFDAADTQILRSMVEHHLLLPDVGTRRDIEDPDTIAAVADQVGSIEVLHLLANLTEADSMATGPSAWSGWKATLVRDLVGRTERHLMGRDPGETRVFPSDEQLGLMAAGELRISADDGQITVVAPDMPGLFSRVAGAVAVSGLDVTQAQIHSQGDMALQEFDVVSILDFDPDWSEVERRIAQSIAGELSVGDEIERRIGVYGDGHRGSPTPIVAPHVSFDNVTSSMTTIIEVGGPDRLGVLYQITRALAERGLDIEQARVVSLGDDVIDSFYVRDSAGQKIVDIAEQNDIGRALLQAVEKTSPPDGERANDE